ncbi:MAG TPA: AAA family ATPase, partial [Chitinophagales bacterium]|nr:AAA family ATPase [Chitinophagales bacterium]
MIKSIRLQNFFGFQDCTVNLEPGANVLIGINGSGKSNFFKALQLLKESIAGIGTSKLINDTWGGSPKVKFLGSNKVLDTFSLSYVFSEPSNYLEHNADALTYEMLFKINPISLNYHLQEYIAAKVENAEKRIFERDINSTNEYSWEGNKIAWMNDTAPDTSFFHDYTDNLEAIHFIPLRQKIKQ